MADPLSVASGIIAVLQLTNGVVSYLKDVKDASGNRNSILLEISANKGVLETLKDLGLTAGPSDPLLSNLQLLEVPLQDYEALLLRLEKDLAPVHGLKKLGKPFKWPFEKQDALNMLAALGRFKTIFALALQVDNLELSRAVKQGLEAIKANQEDEETRNIIDWLSAVNFASQHQDIFSKHQKGTGQWLLNADNFTQWKEGKSRILWCPGVPGAGKTVFSAIALDHLKTSFKEKDFAVLGIYCDYKEFNRQSTSKYLSSLIQQITIQHDYIQPQIKGIYAKHSRQRTMPSFPELLQILRDQMEAFQRVFIIIDALDECTEYNGVRDELLEGILQLPDYTSVMVTSRYIPGIEDYFQHALCLPVHAHDDDIRLHLINRLAKEKTWSRRVRVDDPLQNKIADSVIEKASGMFLLAQLHISSILRKHSRKDVERALRELPEGLDSTYDQVLQRIDDQGEDDAGLAREILSWLTYTLRPLKATELQQALAIKAQDQDFDEDALIHEETMISVCVGLVVIDQESSVIHFVHYTTLEYFTRNRVESFPDGPLNLVTTCLTFLLFDESTKESMPELYSYVAENWGHYARESPESIELVEKIVTFLEDKDRTQQCVCHMSTNKLSPQIDTQIRSLHLAAKFDLVLTMTQLLKNDFMDVNLEDNEGKTPLYYAAMAKQGSVLKLLLERHDIEIDHPSYYQGSPLHCAIESRRPDLAKLLLYHGANPESMDARGERPIHKAIRFDLPDLLQELLKCKVDITSTTHSGHNPLELAMPQDSKLRQKTIGNLWRNREVSAKTQEYAPCLKVILDSLTISDINRGELLFDAVKDGRPDVVELLLKKGAVASFESATYNQRTPLHWAAEKGFGQISKLLLDYGSEVLGKDRRGFTPLHYAALAGHDSIVDLLLPLTDNLEIESKDGKTPYQYAKRHDHESIADKLLSAGAMDRSVAASDVKIVDGVDLRHIQNSQTVLSGKASIPTHDPLLPTSPVTKEEYQRHCERFILAAAQGDVEGVLLCLSKGVSVGERDHEHYKTALHWAAECGNKDIAQLLLDRNSSLSSHDQYGNTPLGYAAESGHVDIVKIFLAHAADVTIKDDRDRTALRLAKDNYHADVVKAFLEVCDVEKLEPDEIDKQNKSLFHWAAEIGNARVCHKLLELRPDAKALVGPDNRGWTPARYARKNKDNELASVLERMNLIAKEL